MFSQKPQSIKVPDGSFYKEYDLKSDIVKFTLKYKGQIKSHSITMEQCQFDFINIEENIYKELLNSIENQIKEEQDSIVDIIAFDDSWIFSIINDKYNYKFSIPENIKNSKDLTKAKLIEMLSVKYPENISKMASDIIINLYPQSGNSLYESATKLPGANEIIKNCPAGNKTCKHYDSGTTTLFNMIIHLNDHHKWTREAIADWIESYFDEVPAFDPPKEVEDEGKLFEITFLATHKSIL